MKSQNTIILILITIAAAIIASVTLISVKIAFLLLAGLIIGITVFFNPFVGLALYIGLIYVRPQDFLPALSPMRIMLNLAIIIIGFALAHKIVRKENFGLFLTRQQILMFIFFLIVPLSDLSNFRLDAAWNSFNEFLTIYLAFVMITTIAGKKYNILYWSTVFALLFMSLNGFLQHYNGIDLFGQVPVAGRIRWVGTFGDPNDFALALVATIPILLFHIFEPKTKTSGRFVLSILLCIFLLAIYYTDSRGGQIALIAVMLAFPVKRWGLKKGLFIGCTLALIMIVASPGRMSNISPYGQSESGRIFAWISGLVMLKSHPVLGVGMHKFTFLHDRAAHSAYIKCMAELGLVGYFVWIALIYTSLRDLIKIERISSDSNVVLYSRITQVSIIGFLVSAFFLSQTYSPIIYILFAIAALFTMQLKDDFGIISPVINKHELIIIIAIEFLSIIAFKVLSMLY
ncbi:MAG: O-antigen ligase family protein [Candidatus Krumholzibacteriota bacterium]|nr:O-antigen ligase family protein [Candidatus Krumholzibacteriota bacterium]